MGLDGHRAPRTVYGTTRACYAISARQVQLVRDAGALAQLPIYLSALGIATAWIGDFAGAASLIAESDECGGGDREPPSRPSPC